jgi:hypothetical protein
MNNLREDAMHDRRQFLLAATSVAGAQLLNSAGATAAENRAAPSGSSLVFTMKVLTGAAVSIGEVSDGILSVIPLTGGSIDGSRVKGTVLGGGASWVRRRRDGSLEFSVRSLIRADNGQIIADLSQGVVGAAKEGKPPQPGHTVHRFEVAAGPYDWLNNVTFFGVVTQVTGGQQVQVYELNV